jgi:hypothetical protein
MIRASGDHGKTERAELLRNNNSVAGNRAAGAGFLKFG